MVAVSSDPLLLNWEKVTGGPVIPIPEDDGSPRKYAVYDPCIWKRDDVYYSLSGGALTDGPGGRRIAADFLFRSRDLETWEYLHPLTEDDRFTLVGDDGACPYFWPIGDRHMLLFFSHISGGQYLLGDYDAYRDKLVVTSHGLFNFGPAVPSGVHAPSAMPDGQGGIIVLFNMNAGFPSPGWDQLMTLPRRLTLAGDDDVRVEPAGDIESLRYDHRHVGPTELPANEEVVLAGIAGNALELALELDPGAASMVELNVLRSPGREEYTRIAFYKDRGFRVQNPSVRPGAVHHNGQIAIGGYKSPWPASRHESLLTLDSSYASTLPGALSRAPETAPLLLDPDEPLRLRVFVDRSVVEVFANGKQCVAVRVYPGREDSTGVSLRAQGSPPYSARSTPGRCGASIRSVRTGHGGALVVCGLPGAGPALIHSPVTGNNARSTIWETVCGPWRWWKRRTSLVTGERCTPNLYRTTSARKRLWYSSKNSSAGPVSHSPNGGVQRLLPPSFRQLNGKGTGFFSDQSEPDFNTMGLSITQGGPIDFLLRQA